MTGVVCTPLRTEHAVLRGAVRTAPVLRTGRGPGGRIRDGHTGQPALIAGVGGALAAHLRPGDLVVADEVRTAESTRVSLAAPLVYGALRRLGLPAYLGPVLSRERVVDGAARAAAATSGALAVDTESAFLAAAAPDGQTVALRAIVDTPDAPLLRPGTAWRGVSALRALRSAAPVIEAWSAALGEREVLLAGPRSFCAGVERAVEIVERALTRYGAPVYVRRQIVHNMHVVGDLEARGAVFVEEVNDIPVGAVTVLAAHGVAPAVRRAAQQRGLRVIDATCPLVAKVHSEVRRYTGRGYTVVLIGHDDHEEVVGTRGEAADRVVVVADPIAAQQVSVDDPDRVAYVMQTTLATDEAEQTAAVLRRRFPRIARPATDDICYATTNRQQAVRAVAAEADLVLVLGSQNSSNSHRLAEVARRCEVPAYLVEDAESVDLAWLADVRRVGITAGASAPPRLVDDLVDCLRGLGPVHTREISVVDENVRFTLPREVS